MREGDFRTRERSRDDCEFVLDVARDVSHAVLAKNELDARLAQMRGVNDV